MIELTQHEIWKVISNAETLDDFYNNYLNKVTLKSEVPSDIQSFVAIAEKLLLHSYYEYEFIDLALTNAIFTFEKALRIRWQEIHGKEPAATFKKLIDWFSNNGYFETGNERFPHLLREIRNGNVHNTSKSLGGIAFFNTTYLVLDLINDLYEEPKLRSLRKEAKVTLSEELSKLTSVGTILSCSLGRIIVNEAFPVFINNKTEPQSLTLFVSPIFDLSGFKDGEHSIPRHFTLQLTDWKFENEVFHGLELPAQTPVSLTPIGDEINSKKYTDWVAEFYKMRDWGLIKFLVTEPMGDIFVSKLRHFHAS